MKKNAPILVFSLLATVYASQASVILMDYDDGTAGGGHDAAVRDGDFENTTASTDNALFSEMPNWTDLLNSGLNATQVDNPSGVGGNRNGVITSNRKFAQSLGYTIAAGDQFQASFMWLDAAKWDNGDHIKMVLFYTDDNTLTGSATDLITFETANRTGIGTWEDAIFGATGFADAGAVDKTLMLRFETNGSVASNEFARFDNISLEAIPEPAVITFIGLFGGSMLWLKRRLR